MGAISEVVEGLISPVTGLISEFIEDKDKASEIAYKISTMAATQAHQQTLGQLEVNKQEAAHRSVFVAGWRPAVGWVCVVALGQSLILLPWVPMIAGLFDKTVTVPAMDMTTVMGLLFPLLGLGAYRTVEKIKGVARER